MYGLSFKDTLKKDYKYNIVSILNMQYKVNIPFLKDKQRVINEYTDFIEEEGLNVSYGKDTINLSSIMLNTIHTALYMYDMNITFENLIFIQNNLLENKIIHLHMINNKHRELLEQTKDKQTREAFKKTINDNTFEKNYYKSVLRYCINRTSFKYEFKGTNKEILIQEGLI